MLLVVDVNVVFSAMYSKGIVYELFAVNRIKNMFEFAAPEYMFLELEKNMELLLSKSKLERSDIDKILQFIREEVQPIPSEEFSGSVPEAFKLLEKHPKDAPYLALASSLGCRILSGDKRLRNLSPENVITPREALDMLIGRDDPSSRTN